MVLFTVLSMVLSVVLSVVVTVASAVSVGMLGRQTSAHPDGTAAAGEGAVVKVGTRVELTGFMAVMRVGTVAMCEVVKAVVTEVKVGVEGVVVAEAAVEGEVMAHMFDFDSMVLPY